MEFNTAEVVEMKNNFTIRDRGKTLLLNQWDIEKIRRFLHWRDIPSQPQSFKIGWFNEIHVDVIVR